MKPEILAPAGNWAMLNSAMKAGADAIYFGIKGMNMRYSAQNFTLEDLPLIGKLPLKTYLALNTIVYDSELSHVQEIIEKAYAGGIDAVICSDMAVLEICREIGMDVHLSTQVSVSNSSALQFYEKAGVTRFVLARELTLEQIKMIKEKTKAEIECFVHGAMCVSVSGRCFMSHFVADKSANRGKCFQPCRRPYIIKDKEMGYELEIGNNYILSPKDLCTLPIIDVLLDSGIDVLKIEGRSKTPEYVDMVVRCYKKAIDAYYDGTLTQELKEKLMKDLETVYNRGFSTGFYLGKEMGQWATVEGNIAKKRKVEVGKVLNFYKQQSVAVIKVLAEDFSLGDELLFLGNKTGVVREEVNTLEVDHKPVTFVQKGNVVAVKLQNLVRENDKVYKVISDVQEE